MKRTILGEVRVKGELKLYVQDDYGICIANKRHYDSRNKRATSLHNAIDKTNYFINRCSNVHRGNYDYSLADYKRLDTKILVICSNNHIFQITPGKHLNGGGCKKCHIKSRTKTLQEAINDFKKIHGDRYDYRLVNYKNNDTKVTVICQEHGKFTILPSKLSSIQGCPDCGSFNRWLRDKEPDSPAIFYSVKCWENEECFYKVGVTTASIKERLAGKHMPYDYEIVQEIHTTMHTAYHTELLIKKRLKNYLYRPLIEFGGSNTECFKINIF